MKKVLFVASEAVPFIKTGGLADVVGSLPKCFDKEEYKLLSASLQKLDKFFEEKIEDADKEEDF